MSGTDSTIDDAPVTRLEAYILGRVADERRHRRIVVSLPVRFMLADNSEHRGLLFDMSPGGLSLTTEAKPAIGAKLILYIDDIGRAEGTVSRHHPYGFAIKLAVTQNRRDKIAERLIFHANRHRLRDDDLREHERVETDQQSHCVMPDGTELPCRVVDLSLTGAAIVVDPAPPMGSEISIGKMRGKVVRTIAGGVAIRFMTAVSSHAGASERLRR